MKKIAVIVAGGSGLRMKISVPKQFLPLMGKPILLHTLDTFLESYSDMEVILVLPVAHLEVGIRIAEQSIDPKRVKITTGGETRFHSVQNGLRIIQQHCIIFVHDAVRCLISTDLIHRCYEAALDKGNAIPATTAVDTIRFTDFNGNHQIDRNHVKIIQTPQTFFSELVKTAFEQDYSDEFTDEASVVERLGVKINLVEGEETNIKITRPVDLLIAEKILEERYM
ncbi:MAG: 2-C-methyl-D-erythritol 4-phosphate cytidylyltransferase [Flavitalea sp.]